MRKKLEIISSVLLVITMVLGGSVHAQTWQQQQRQQDFMRQRQIDQQRQDAMREQMRRAEQERVRDQIRQQQRDQVRNDQRARAQEDVRTRIQQERSNDAKQQVLSTAKQQREDWRQQGKLGVARPGDQASRGPFRASNGIAQAPRQPTPAEAKRGFTGKVTPDGKALVRFQNRVVTVPASRIGVLPRQTATSQAALATGWSQQKQASINADIKRLIGGGGGGGGSAGGGGTGAGKSGITGTFNAAANQTGISPAFNAATRDRIALASSARGLSSDKKYDSIDAPKASVARILPGSLSAAEENAVLNTIKHIDAGTRPTGSLAKRWGIKFENRKEDLPGPTGADSPYLEYRVAPSPGTTGAGANRIVVNKHTGEMYYTWTHYGDNEGPAFVKVR